MAKIPVGNMVIKFNEKLTGKHYKIFTEHGHNKINEFLQTYSRDFRVVFDILWNKYQAQPTEFYGSDFLKILDNSKSFKKFVFAVSLQQMFKIKFPFAEFYVKLFKACYTNYQINTETGARGWVVGAFHSLIATYPEYRIFLLELIQSLDITENINSGRFIYLDEHIALTYNQDIKNEGLGELLFAARNYSGLWTFNKTDVFVPVKSLRYAKYALVNYQGKPRKGQLVGNDSVRFSNFLGLKVRDNYAYMPNYQELKSYRGKGFK